MELIGTSGVKQDIVIVPQTECPLSQAEFASLRSIITPFKECDNYGIGLYAANRAFVYSVSL